MKTFKKSIFFLVIALMTLHLSCSGDDDGASVTRIGFFPKTISTTTTSGTVMIEFSYDTNSRMVSFETSDSGVSFEYNDQGLISVVTANDGTESFEVEYSDGIMTQISESNSGDITSVSYFDGTYEFMGTSRSFNEDNQLTSFGGSDAIEYNTEPGPFKELDFQPMLFFLGGSSVVRQSYFFSKNEINSFSIPLGGLLQCTSQRDDNDNIELVIASDVNVQEVYRFEISYEEREIIN